MRPAAPRNMTLFFVWRRLICATGENRQGWGERLTVYKLHENEQLRFDRKVTHPLPFFFSFFLPPSTISISFRLLSSYFSLLLPLYLTGAGYFQAGFTSGERYIGYTDRVFKILSAAWFL